MASPRPSDAENKSATVQAKDTAVGAATIALGTFAGLMAPGTRRENELMGRRRDQAVHQAQGYASEAVERGQRAVKQTVEETAKETANEAIETALDTNDEE